MPLPGHSPPVPDTEENKLLPALTPQTSAELKERNAAAGVNEGVLELPVPESPGGAFGPDDEINQFCGWLKVRLRKGQVRFDKADAVLKELGVASSWRYGKEGDEKLRKKWEKKDVVDPGEGGGDETREDDDEGGGKRSKIDPDNTAEGVDVKLRPAEKKTIDFRGKLYLAPLTTTGNLPFRRICKRYGVDITCGEMAMVTNLLQGQPAEWALLRRHPSEDIFGAQVCGGYSDSMSRCMQLLEDEVVSKGGLDFIDINMGCPIDLVCNKGAGSMLLEKPARMEQLVRASAPLLSCPLTLKTRMGYFDNKRVAHEIIPKMVDWGLAGMTLHGRSRQQRYSRLADWDYINQCARASPIQLIGNGDVFSYHDYVKNVEGQGVATCMIARGALIKPWIFTEIKERRDWDISATERLDMLKDYAAFGLEHWGADARGVANTRRFLLEWLSFLHRYVPVGLLERMPVGIHQRPPNYVGRSDLETLLSSPNSEDWVKITTMLLGPTPDNFSFQPKHKSNAYRRRATRFRGEGKGKGSGASRKLARDSRCHNKSINSPPPHKARTALYVSRVREVVENRKSHQVVRPGQPAPPLELPFKLPSVQHPSRVGANRVFEEPLARIAAYVQDDVEAGDEVQGVRVQSRPRRVHQHDVVRVYVEVHSGSVPAL